MKEALAAVDSYKYHMADYMLINCYEQAATEANCVSEQYEELVEECKYLNLNDEADNYRRKANKYKKLADLLSDLDLS